MRLVADTNVVISGLLWFNLVSNIVHYGHSGVVDSVMVDGEFLMRDGWVLCLDEKEVVANAQAATESAWRRLHGQSPEVPLPGTPPAA